MAPAGDLSVAESCTSFCHLGAPGSKTYRTRVHASSQGVQQLSHDIGGTLSGKLGIPTDRHRGKSRNSLLLLPDSGSWEQLSIALAGDLWITAFWHRASAVWHLDNLSDCHDRNLPGPLQQKQLAPKRVPFDGVLARRCGGLLWVSAGYGFPLTLR